VKDGVSRGVAEEAVLTRLRAAFDRADIVSTRALDRYAYASDASHFSLVPRAVAVPRDADEVARLMHSCADLGLSMTFRSGGTSLSGQAVTDSVLVDTRRHFRDLQVLDEGDRVSVQPGVTVRRLNAALAKHGRRFGPDPASEVACTIGGVLANNSSGMSCGTTHNAYSTLVSVKVVLPQGAVLDTSAPDADSALRHHAPALYAGLTKQRDELRADPVARAEIARQFGGKNTMGYSLNAFLDHTRPSDILAHLLVGSEGTLGFVHEATFRTIPLLPHVTTGLFVFGSLAEATGALPDLVGTGPVAVELLDVRSLRVAASGGDAPEELVGRRLERQAALLVEYAAQDAEGLAQLLHEAEPVLSDLGVNYAMTSDPQRRARLWRIRKGLYASVAGARPAGTTALLEDVAVPVPKLQVLVEGIDALLAEHGYADGVIFGHAKDGNVHFMITDRFDSAPSMARLTSFTERLADLVLSLGGTLKAEHGTGRMMEPFVRRQYGDRLYQVMRDVRRLFDPDVVLSPGVLIGTDSDVHSYDLKAFPPVDPAVDRCVECGYCEPTCPSRDLTLTPRQRIVVHRALAAARARGDESGATAIEEDFEYAVLNTCAVDGMCQTTCPVLINTGDLVKRLRAGQTPSWKDAVGKAAARHWSGATRTLSAALRTGSRVPGIAHRATALARSVLPGHVPLWTAELPAGGRPRSWGIRRTSGPFDAVYFPSCVGATFGPTDEPGVQEAFQELCDVAGIRLLIPDTIDRLCCAMPWSSKGLADGAAEMRGLVRMAEAEWPPALPVIVDSSSCVEGLMQSLEHTGDHQPVDVTQFVLERVVPVLGPPRRIPSMAVHPTCSSVRAGDTALHNLASAMADRIDIPDDWGCCGFAGDRGLLQPELTASATRVQAREVLAQEPDAHVSCNRPCEMALSRATGRSYRHIVVQLAEQYRPSQENQR